MAVPTFEMQRKYESERKRRYRAVQRSYRQLLVDELTRLQATVGQLRRTHAWRECAVRQLQEHAASLLENKWLRRHLEHQKELVRTLWAWIHTSIQPTLGEGNPWLHSTLLADPVARHYGFRWLTDRIFHNALRAHAVVDPSVQDMMHINLHTNDDGWDMVGIENFSQTTVLAHFKDVANCMWDIFTATQITDVHLQQVGHVLMNGSNGRRASL
ncbi:Aste57867_12576 [Aphanomyces stellatus]|uniref:Aste57867_12576 protein n=1 Tax=Aphanomyces stellatus TaxID=120398 RepID=A0A485KWD0_9STRA|nr:hypothetical protein As57867_012530 [Aphanomyces stellatus]VFT89427.1 Aste57867_12576 [Aphanomyces stellatus]